MHTDRCSHPPGEWWVASYNNTDTPIPDFNYLYMDPDEGVLNTSPNILDDEEPQFYRQAISTTNTDLWHSAIEADIDAHWHN
jgi:hypothetical protein